RILLKPVAASNELLREEDADVVAFDVVGDEVGLAVVVHVDDFNAPSAFAGPEGRTGGALESTAAVAEEHGDAVFRTEGEIDFSVTIQIHGQNAPTTVPKLQR